MNTYKIGNTVTAIIRTYASTEIAGETLQYDNQPYTIIKGAEAQISFDTISTTTNSRFAVFTHSAQQPKEVKIFDAHLTERMMNLLFGKMEPQFISKVENGQVVDGRLYINAAAETIYQLFVYDTKQKLVYAAGTHETATPIELEDGNYLVCYQYIGSKAFDLATRENRYYTLDLVTQGNADDHTMNATIHIEKCGLEVDKNLMFDQSSGSANLKFVVLDTGKDYIALDD